MKNIVLPHQKKWHCNLMGKGGGLLQNDIYCQIEKNIPLFIINLCIIENNKK